MRKHLWAPPIVVLLLVVSACGAPYDDAKLANAVADADHVTSVNGTCSQEGLGSWSCYPQVEMSSDATGDDITAALEGTIDMLDADSAEITVGRGSSRRVTIDVDEDTRDARRIAEAVRAVLDLDVDVSADFAADADHLEISMAPDERSVASIVEDARRIFEQSRARRLILSQRDPDIAAVVDRGAWPQAELDALAAVREVTSVSEARIKQGSLTIVVADKVGRARRAASRVAGFDSIASITISRGDPPS